MTHPLHASLGVQRNWEFLCASPLFTKAITRFYKSHDNYKRND
jgi:hypothetical protein